MGRAPTTYPIRYDCQEPEQRRQGYPGEIYNVQIAAIAAARKATLPARNIRHFQGIGISLIDL